MLHFSLHMYLSFRMGNAHRWFLFHHLLLFMGTFGDFFFKIYLIVKQIFFFFCFILFCSINQCLIYTTQGKPLLLLFGIPQLKAIKFSVTKLGLLVECQVPSQATLSLPFSVGWGREYKMDKQKDRQVYSLLPTSEGCSATSQKAGLQLQKANIVK